MNIHKPALLSITLAGLFASLSGCSAQEEQFQGVYGDGKHVITVATGSPGALGLVEALAAEFNKTHDTTIQWREAGSGASLKLLKAKKAHVALVHAPAAEEKAVAEGWAANRTLFGSNEFYIVGPKNDPAGIAEAESAADAYARVAKAKAKFVSRGDNSGTHKKEKAIWKTAGIEPSGDWYIVADDFMLGTLLKANDAPGYYMTDSSTWVATKKKLNNLAVLFKGDPVLVNVYHGLCQPKGASPEQPYAEEFIQFLGTDQAQAALESFGVKQYGAPLYHGVDATAEHEH